MHFCLLEYPNVPFAEARLALVDDGWGVQEVRFAFAQNVSLWKPKNVRFATTEGGRLICGGGEGLHNLGFTRSMIWVEKKPPL